MPVTTTPTDILVAAYGTSIKNRPSTLATDATEMLQVVIRALRGLYAVGARVNPHFFAESADVAFSVSGWPRPQTAEAVFRLERVAGTTGGTGAAGAEVVVVPFNDRAAELGKPAVYRFAQKFWSAGNPADPTAGALKFFYSKRPTDPANVDATLDALWTEQFNHLLIVETAIYLSFKDGRPAEVAKLMDERNDWLKLFVAFLEHETVNERARFGAVKPINIQTLLPMLAGAKAA